MRKKFESKNHNATEEVEGRMVFIQILVDKVNSKVVLLHAMRTYGEVNV
jgi:hypothetical protein